MATVSAAAALRAAPTLVAGSGTVQFSAVSLAASPVLVVSGTQTALAAAPELGASARVIKNASAALGAPAVLSASVYEVVLAASPALAAAGGVTEQASAGLAAAASLQAASGDSAAALSAAPVLSAPGRSGSAVLSAGTRLRASASSYMPGDASLAASAQLFLNPSGPQEAILDEGGGLILDEITNPLFTEGYADLVFVTEAASAALSAVPALSAAASSAVQASAGLSAQPLLSASYSGSAAALSAAGVLSAEASAAILAEVPMASAASMSVAAEITSPASAILSSSPEMTASASVSYHAQAALAARAALTAAGSREITAAAAMTAVASLAAAATREQLAAAGLPASAVLSVQASSSPGAHLAAAPSLSAAATAGRSAASAMRAGAVLSATASKLAGGQSSLSAAPSLAAVPLAQMVASASMSALSALAASADISLRTGPPLRPRVQPTWQRDVQSFAIEQERERHAQALWQFGELVMFCLLWRPRDIAAGLAQRCTRCYSPSAVIPVNPALPQSTAAAEAQISAAYGQGSQYRCPLCYGTQIIAAGPAAVPGVRALIVRPAILTDTDQNQQRTAKGVLDTGSVNIQTIPDFRAHTMDYAFRSDGRRYQLAVPGRTTLRTGFATPWQQSAAIDYNLMRATLEDPLASVAYIVPPAEELLAQALGTYTRVPVSYAWIEHINGPLIPEENPPPAASGGYQPAVTFPLNGSA